MEIIYIPTLEILQELYSKERDMSRFEWYLQQMLGENEEGELDVVVPITAANPMGREHCLAKVNALLELKAEEVAQQAFEEATVDFPDVDQPVRAAITLLDDIGGGWTNRYLNEAAIRMCTEPRDARGNQKRRFVTVSCWTSEAYSAADIRAEARTALFRYAHLQRHGHPNTLQQIMTMDGEARAFAGHTPQLDADELEYTEEVIGPFLESADFGVQFACLFGDEAAQSTGYTPQGFGPYAGFEFALEQALPFHQ